jgi:DNA-binding Lrp family transcriptional regulator
MVLGRGGCPQPQRQEDRLQAYVLVQTQSHQERLAGRLSTIPGVLSAEDLTGAYDAVVLAIADSTRELMDGVIEAIRSVPGVTRALPAPLIRTMTRLVEANPSATGPTTGDQAA